MADYFFDSSALVKRYVQEVGSAWVCRLTDPPAGNVTIVSRITGVEVVSALTRKARGGGISAADARAAIAKFRGEFTTGFAVLEITPGLLAEAVRMAEAHRLRAYDAVQLAAALELKTRLLADGLAPPMIISADNDLNSAAQAEGFVVDDPNAHP